MIEFCLDEIRLDLHNIRVVLSLRMQLQRK